MPFCYEAEKIRRKITVLSNSRLKITSLIIEGGAQIAASALHAGMVQKIHFFYGPKILGGSGLSGIGDLSVKRLEEAIKLRGVRLKHLSGDFGVEAYVDFPALSPS